MDEQDEECIGLGFAVGDDLAYYSVEELEAQVFLLSEEIKRLNTMIAQKKLAALIQS